MTISETDLALIRSTRPVFTLRGDQTGRDFYAALFRRDPDLRPLFPDDLSDLARKLVSTISVIIESAKDWDLLAPVLESLARRHLAYQVRPEHYTTVGMALLDALRAADTSAPVQEAWARTYCNISDYMIAQAYPNDR